MWLDPALTSPYEFFQFWLRTGDPEVGSYLRRFTFLGRERIAELEEATASRPERRAAQRELAWELTAMVHGEDEARRAEQAAAVLFTPGIATLDAAILETALADAPTVEVARAALEQGRLTVLDALLQIRPGRLPRQRPPAALPGLGVRERGPDTRRPAPGAERRPARPLGRAAPGSQPAVRAGGHRR